jgi:hypothetical protein
VGQFLFGEARARRQPAANDVAAQDSMNLLCDRVAP